MANPVAVPGTSVPSSSLVTPGGSQGTQGIQGPIGPNAVSTDAGNIATLGSDSKIYVPTHTGPIAIRVFTASGTYTPTAGMNTCIIECVGGGGGGGGVPGITNYNFIGGGGGSGGYSRTFATAAQIGASQTVTIGAAGAGGIGGGAVATAGGATSVGTLCTANGGTGGAAGNGPGSATGAGGAAGTGTLASAGAPGGPGLYCPYNATYTPSYGPAGVGGSSIFGGGATYKFVTGGTSAAGNNATGYGSGGGGAAVSGVATNVNGGAGFAGVVIITEYS